MARACPNGTNVLAYYFSASHHDLLTHFTSSNSHTMLKNKDNKAYKAFMKIKTQRRICLTGTPFQNNLMEYYHMFAFVRPNLLGGSERKFQKEYMEPIQESMGSDAPEDVKVIADERLTQFVEILEPYIHRRDASLLRKDLPSLQQACLHVPPTKMQRAFYGAFREHQEATNDHNFLKQYTSLRGVHNHPGTLLFGKEKSNVVSQAASTGSRKRSGSDIKRRRLSEDSASLDRKTSKSRSIKTKGFHTPENSGRQSPDSNDVIEVTSSSDENEDNGSDSDDTGSQWWTKVAKKFGFETMKRIERYAIHRQSVLCILSHVILPCNLMKLVHVQFDLLDSLDGKWQQVHRSFTYASTRYYIGGKNSCLQPVFEGTYAYSKRSQ